LLRAIRRIACCATPFRTLDPVCGQRRTAARRHREPDCRLRNCGLRIVDNVRVNPQTVMPSYYRVEGLTRVASPFRGKPILTAREVEDVVAYLGTLR
jgi:sulfur-oxidizing protein SoxX